MRRGDVEMRPAPGRRPTRTDPPATSTEPRWAHNRRRTADAPAFRSTEPSETRGDTNVRATKFHDKYGGKVQVVRGIDGDLNTKVEAEKQTGHVIADVLVSASLPTIQGHVEQGGWFLPATGPDFDATAYNKAANYQKG